MAISRVQNVSATANNVALASCLADDIIVVWAYFAGTATIPTLPSGFTSIVGTAGTQQAARLGWKRAVGGETNSGTWTNATQVVCMVYRGCLATASPFGTTPTITAANSNAISMAARTLVVTNGTSIILGFAGGASTTAGMNNNPTGGTVALTNRTNVVKACGMDSAPTAANYTAQTFTVTTSGRMQSVTIELKAAPLQALTLPCVKGDFALTGNDVSVLWGQRGVVLPAGSFALTGKDVAISQGWFMPLAQGGYALAGQTLGFFRSRVMPLVQGGFVLDGQAMNTLFGRTLIIGGGGLNDGDPVTPWPDLSGNGNDGIIVASPDPKIRLNALNGRAVVRFNGNEGRIRGNTGILSSGLPAPGYNFTVIYVSRMVGPNPGRIFTATYPPPNFLVGYHTTGDGAAYDNGWIPAAPSGYAALPTPWRVYSYTGSHDGTNYLGSFFKDGVLLGTTVGGAGLHDRYNLSGYSPTGTEETCDCEVAILLIYNHKLVDADRAGVEKGVADYYALSVAGGTAIDPISLPGLNVYLKADSLATAVASFKLTGQPITLTRASPKILVIVQGAFALAGQPVSFLRGRFMPLVKGQYNLTGQAVNFLRSRIMSLVKGAFALGGQAINFLRGRNVLLTQASYSLTGIPVTLTKTTARVMAAVQGAFALAGKPVALIRSRIMPVPQGAYTLTGKPVGFLRGRGMQLVQGAYTLTGKAVNLLLARKTSLLTGNFALTGRPVTLLQARRIVLTQSAYSLAGQPANLSLARRLAAAFGSYAVIGEPVLFPRTRKMLFLSGTFSLAGQPVLLRVARYMPADSGMYFLSGYNVVLLYSGGEFWKFYAGQVTQSALLATFTDGAFASTSAASDFIGTPDAAESSFIGTPASTAGGLAISVASGDLKVEKTE